MGAFASTGQFRRKVAEAARIDENMPRWILVVEQPEKMPDEAPYDWAAATRESAKALQPVTEAAGNLGSYIAEVLGSAPHNLMGVINDRIQHSRVRRAAKLYAGTKKILEDAGLDTSRLQPPTPSIEVPLLEGAVLEDREELTVLWEQLLASAIDPRTRDRVRVSHINILKQIEPLDAWILQNIQSIRSHMEKQDRNKIGIFSSHDFFMSAVAVAPQATDDEIRVSIQHLAGLGLVSDDMSRPASLVSAGRVFLSAVNGDR